MRILLTGPEIARDVPDVDMFVAGLGTGGTLMGVGRALREHNPDVKIVAAAPHPDDKVQGLRSIEHGFIPRFLILMRSTPGSWSKLKNRSSGPKKLLTDAGAFVGVSSGRCSQRDSGSATFGERHDRYAVR